MVHHVDEHHPEIAEQTEIDQEVDEIEPADRAVGKHRAQIGEGGEGVEPLVLLRWMRLAEADPDPDQGRAEQWHRQPERRTPAEQDRELPADDGTRDVTEAAAG